MDNRPIGIFDSGIGGLTSIPPLMRMLPNERIIFFGDTARTPYGSKSPETIKQFTSQVGDFLVKKDVKMLMIACNTISATSLDMLKERYPDIPVIGVISPTARVVANKCNGMDRIGILATKATIKSGMYEKKIKEKNYQLKNIFPIACPALVPLIEEGIIDHEIMDLTIKYYLDEFMKENEIDNLVLGCTHYPLIKENLERLYPNVSIISSSREVAVAAMMELEDRDMLAEKHDGENYFYASDLSDNFVTMIEKILGTDKETLNIQFRNLDI